MRPAIHVYEALIVPFYGKSTQDNQKSHLNEARVPYFVRVDLVLKNTKLLKCAKSQESHDYFVIYSKRDINPQ